MLPNWQPYAVEAVAAALQRLRGAGQVLYFGDGSANAWLRGQALLVHAVDHDQQRAAALNSLYVPRPYYSVCDTFENEKCLDVVIVDGCNRKACIRYAAPLVKPGGLILLDDSSRPWYKLGISVLLGWERIPEHGPASLEGTRVWRRPPEQPYVPPQTVIEQIKQLRDSTSR